jgi:hypothetical protein
MFPFLEMVDQRLQRGFTLLICALWDLHIVILLTYLVELNELR